MTDAWMVIVNIYKAVNIFREEISACLLLCSGLSRKSLLGYYYSWDVTKKYQARLSIRNQNIRDFLTRNRNFIKTSLLLLTVWGSVCASTLFYIFKNFINRLVQNVESWPSSHGKALISVSPSPNLPILSLVKQYCKFLFCQGNFLEYSPTTHS